MEINVSEDGKVTVIAIEGEVDMYTSPDLRAKLQELIKGKANRLCLDFNKVKYIDSSGIATLIEAQQKLAPNKGKLGLAAISSSVFSIFEIAKLDKVFQIYPDLQTALKELS